MKERSRVEQVELGGKEGGRCEGRRTSEYGVVQVARRVFTWNRSVVMQCEFTQHASNIQGT